MPWVELLDFDIVAAVDLDTCMVWAFVCCMRIVLFALTKTVTITVKMIITMELIKMQNITERPMATPHDVTFS